VPEELVNTASPNLSIWFRGAGLDWLTNDEEGEKKREERRETNP
jgi:hypothetical protein